jgi:hypothetical protein
MTTTYETDYRAWALAQAVALRQLRPEGLDYARLAEEIESLGRDMEKHAERCLQRIMEGMLKCAYAPLYMLDNRRRWVLDIQVGRRKLAREVHENPSLVEVLAGLVADAYMWARLEVMGRLDMDDLAEQEGRAGELPEECPWSVEELQREEFYPDTPAARKGEGQ